MVFGRVSLVLILAAGACSLLTDLDGIEGDPPVTGAGGSGAATGGNGGTWLDPGYASRKRLTLDTTITTVDLTDITLAVVLSDPELAGAGYADGRDIAFTAADGVTRLGHELEYFDRGTGDLVAWVSIPVVQALTPSDIYVYFGNPAADDQQDLARTWPSATYRGIWHLSQNPSAAGKPMLDSTANGNHGDPDGNPTSVTGIAAQALSFDGDVDRVVIADLTGSLDVAELSSFSFSVWALITEFSGAGDELVQQFGATGAGFLIDITPNDSWYSGVSDGTTSSTVQFGTDADFLSRWSHLVCVVDFDGSSIQAYAQGSFREERDLTVSLTNTMAGLQLCPAGNPCKGILDEVRVYAMGLSADWIALEHRNLDPDAPAFVTSGPVEHAP